MTTGAGTNEARADGDLKIEVREGGLECYVTVLPPRGGGAPVLPAGAQSRLAAAGVVFGVDKEILEAMVRRCAETLQPQEGIVARGRPPTPGEPATFEILVHPPERPTVAEVTAESDQGAMDYHYAAPIINVEAGTVVARKTRATDGLRGTTVLGKEIAPPPAVDETPRATFRIDLQEEGRRTIRYVATEAGEFVHDPKTNTVFIMTEHIISGDVTVASGDIIFGRDIVVRGNVTEGAIIRAGGNITIVGRVDAAFIHAGGDISISQGIVAGGRGLVEAGGNVDSAFAEQAVIRAGGDVNIRKGILNSDISARGSVFCNQGRGAIIGGIVRATRTIEAKKFGSPSSPETQLVVGSDYLLLERRDALKEQVRVAKENVHKLNLALGPVIEGADLSKYPDDVKENIRKALEQRSKQQQAVDQLCDELRSVEHELASQTGGSVRVLSEAQPGTHIRIRDMVLTLNQTVKYAELRENPAYRTITPYPIRG